MDFIRHVGSQFSEPPFPRLDSWEEYMLPNNGPITLNLDDEIAEHSASTSHRSQKSEPTSPGRVSNADCTKGKPPLAADLTEKFEPILSHEQLVAEVRQIYAGLVALEKKCKQIDIEFDKARDQKRLLDGIHQRYHDDHHIMESQLRRTVLNWQKPIDNNDMGQVSPRDRYTYTVKSLQARRSGKAATYVISMKLRVVLLRVLNRIDPLRAAAEHLDNDAEVNYLLGLIEDISSRLDAFFSEAQTMEPGYAGIIDDLICEFPRKFRHLCTTMPWTIWPALVVLWGVCWMFHPRPGVDESPSAAILDYLCDPSTSYWYNPEGNTGMDLMDGLSAPIDSNFEFNSVDVFDQPLTINDVSYPVGQPAPTPYSTTDSTLQRFPDMDLVVGPSGSLGASRNSDEGLDITLADGAPYNSQVGEGYSSSAPSQGLKFTCRHCGKKFKKQFTLNRHENEQHGAQKKYACPYPHCKKSKEGQGFARKDHLDRHLRTCRYEAQQDGPISGDVKVASPRVRITLSLPPRRDNLNESNESRQLDKNDSPSTNAMIPEDRGVQRVKRARDVILRGIEAKKQKLEALEREMQQLREEIENDRKISETMSHCIRIQTEEYGEQS